MKFLSLFDGCHMFGHALRNVGAECVGTSEIDKHAAAVTSYHYPQTPALGDVQNVKSTNADLIVAGFPCQDLSVAGDRRGLAGERSGLFWEIVRIARDNATPWLLLENVPGLLSSNGGRDMGAVLGALGELGYGWAYRVLDAQHFGVPQRRRRVFIVGCLGDARRAGKVLFEPESVRGDSAPSREAGEGFAGGVARCLTAEQGQRNNGTKQNFIVRRWPADIAPTLDASFGRLQGQDDQHINTGGGHFVSAGGDISHTMTGEGQDASEDGTGRDRAPVIVADMAQITSATNGSNPKPGDPAPTLAATSRMTAVDVWQACGGSVGTMGTLRCSVNAGNGVPFLPHGSSVRRLTPIECERLQGLLDDWTKHGRRSDGTTYEMKDGPRYRMIGNGGAVPVVEWIGRRIMRQEARA